MDAHQLLWAHQWLLATFAAGDTAAVQRGESRRQQMLLGLNVTELIMVVTLDRMRRKVSQPATAAAVLRCGCFPVTAACEH